MNKEENLKKVKKEEITEEVKEEIKTEISEEKAKEITAEKVSEIPKEEFKEKRREDRAGIAYINSTFNNTIVHVTDMAGNTISRITGGMVTKQDRLKANPTIAMFVAKKAAERARDLGITSLYIRTRGKTGEGMGPGGHAAVKSLSKEGFRVISILDTTRFPRGGPKKKGGRRGRRV